MTGTIPERRTVILVSSDGVTISYFETNRMEFPTVATYDRDRIFGLAFTGDLSSLPGASAISPLPMEGAIYAEMDCWRISTKTINLVRPRRKHSRRSAQIFHFPMITRKPGGEDHE